MDFLRPLAENYPTLEFKKQKPPSFVHIYTKQQEEIVFIHTQNKSTETTNYSNGTELKPPKEELDLTGSPLKLDLSLHTILDDTLISDEPQLYSKEESYYEPVDIDKAREVAILYNKTLTASNEEAIPMWILCNPTSTDKPLLLTVQTDENHFARGIVNYEESSLLDEVDLDKLSEDYCKLEKINSDVVSTTVDCRYLVSGMSYGSRSTDDLLNAPHGGVTELHCQWTGKTLHTPYITCKVTFEQEVTVGHLASPCNAIWKSVCVLHNINQILVDMTAAGHDNVNLNTAVVRPDIIGAKKTDPQKRLNDLLNEIETYAYTSECPAGGFICVSEDTNTLRQCMGNMCAYGSSNDFTYKLWDVLRECDNAEMVVTLLLQALKFISSGKIRPFIDTNNKTYLSKLVLKLSRGHSQAGKVLKNIRASPPQALSLVAQVGVEKTTWEYTKVMSLLEHSFFVASIWTTDARTHESIEQINQTIQDMTMTGDFTLNPFETLSTAENSIRLDCESFYEDDAHELTVDDFASLKKHGLVQERKDVNEVPLITDEIDISPWKNLLMKFAQVHVCLEHLYRAEIYLRLDFANLKPIASRLLEHYLSDKSPVKTVGQLMSDPVQTVSMPITNNVVQDHLKKPAFWYRVEMKRKKDALDQGVQRDSKVVFVFSQQPVFPPSVWHNIEPPTENMAEVTTIGGELKYYCTKYTYLSNKITHRIDLGK